MKALVASLLLLTTLPVLAQRQRSVATPIPNGASRISEEFAVGNLDYVPTDVPNRRPRVASGPEQSLAVWTSDQGVEAARLDSSGTPIDLTPIALHSLGQPSYPPDVVWDGAHYVVLVGAYADDGWILRLVGVSTDGRVDSIAQLPTRSSQPVALALARHSSGELAIAMLERAPSETALSPVVVVASERGAVTREISFPDAPFNTVIHIAAAPSGYAVVWDGGGASIALHGDRVTRFELPAGENDVAWTGTGYLVVNASTAYGSPSTGVIRAMPLSEDGTAGALFVLQTGTFEVDFPVVVWDGERAVVVWKRATADPSCCATRTFDLWGARLSPDGSDLIVSLLDSGTDWTAKFSGGIDAPALSTNGQLDALVWTRPESAALFEPTTADVFAATWDRMTWPRPLDIDSSMHRISSKAAYELSFAVDSRNKTARLFWNEPYIGLPPATFTGSIDELGRRSDVEPLPFVTAPLVAHAPSGSVMVWREAASPYRLVSSLVLPDGGTTTPAALIAPGDGTWASPIALACGASDCALLYSTQQGNDGTTIVSHVVRFVPNGGVTEGPIEIPTGPTAIAARGNEYLIVFHWPMQDHNVVVSRYAGGRLSDITTLVPSTFTYRSAIASKDDEWLVVWSEQSMPSNILTAFRIDAGGSLLSQTEIHLAPGALVRDFAAAWDGKNWIVVWSASGLMTDIQGARIAADGTLLDHALSGDGFGVAATVADEYTFSISSSGDGRTAVAYSRTTSDRQFGFTSRVFLRWIEDR